MKKGLFLPTPMSHLTTLGLHLGRLLLHIPTKKALNLSMGCLQVCLKACGTSLNRAWFRDSFGNESGGGVSGAGGGDGLAFSLWNIISSQKGLESISKKDNKGSGGGGDSDSKSGVVGRLWGVSTSGLSKVHHEESGPYLGKDRGGKGRGVSSSSAWTEGFWDGPGDM